MFWFEYFVSPWCIHCCRHNKSLAGVPIGIDGEAIDKLCQLTLHRAQTVDRLGPEYDGNENKLQEMLDTDFSGRLAAIGRHESRSGLLPSVSSTSRYEAGLGRWLEYTKKQRQLREELKVDFSEEQMALLDDVGEHKSGIEMVRLL